MQLLHGILYHKVSNIFYSYRKARAYLHRQALTQKKIKKNVLVVRLEE